VAICRSAHSRRLNDGAVFPIPDLRAEIDISHPMADDIPTASSMLVLANRFIAIA
jgi:hypothetical protein